MPSPVPGCPSACLPRMTAFCTKLPVCLLAEKIRVLYQRRRSLPRKAVQCTVVRRCAPRKTAFCTALRLGAMRETALCILTCCEAPRIVVLCTSSTRLAPRNVDPCTRGSPSVGTAAVRRDVFLGRNEKRRYGGRDFSAPRSGWDRVAFCGVRVRARRPVGARRAPPGDT